MGRLGFFIIHNKRAKMVHTVDIPWDFTFSLPYDLIPQVEKPVTGDWNESISNLYMIYPEDVVYKSDNQIIINDYPMPIDALEEGEYPDSLYRATYGDTGIYNALKNILTEEEWKEFINDEKVDWLEHFDNYETGYQSYFTEEGYEKFRVNTLPLVYKYLEKDKIRIEHIFLVEREPVEEYDQDNNIMLLDEENEIPNESEETETDTNEPTESKEPKPEVPQFSDWIKDYFENILTKDSDFLRRFNNERTYIIISQEDETIMGLMTIHKGWTEVNFDEHDYRILINNIFPDIRNEIALIPDTSFGGYDKDGNFSLDSFDQLNKPHKPKPPRKPDYSFGGYDEDKNFTVVSQEKEESSIES